MEVKRAHNLSKRQNIYNIRARKKYFLKNNKYDKKHTNFMYSYFFHFKYYIRYMTRRYLIYYLLSILLIVVINI